MKNFLSAVLALIATQATAHASISVDFDPRNGTYEQLCACGEITSAGGASMVASISFRSPYAENRFGVAACGLTFLENDLALGAALFGSIGKYLTVTKVNDITTYSVSSQCR